MTRDGIQWMMAWVVSAVCHFAVLAAAGRWLHRKEWVRTDPAGPPLSLTTIEFDSAPPDVSAVPPNESPEILEPQPESATSPQSPNVEVDEKELAHDFETHDPQPEATVLESTADTVILEPPAVDFPVAESATEPLPAQTTESIPNQLEAETARNGERRTDEPQGPVNPEVPLPSSHDSKSPSLLVAIRPRYPLGSRLRGEEGLVVVRAWVTPAGTVRSAEIAVSSRFPALDEAARRAVLGARFQPFAASETDEEAKVELRIRFVLKEP